MYILKLPMVVALSEWFLGLVAWFFLVVVVAWWIRVVAVVGGMDSRPRHQMMCLVVATNMDHPGDGRMVI